MATEGAWVRPSNIFKKLKKGNTPEEVADIQEDEKEIIRIYKVAERFAPDYDVGPSTGNWRNNRWCLQYLWNKREKIWCS